MLTTSGSATQHFLARQWGWGKLDGHYHDCLNQFLSPKPWEIETWKNLLDYGNIALFSAWPMGSAWGCKKGKKSSALAKQATRQQRATLRLIAWPIGRLHCEQPTGKELQLPEHHGWTMQCWNRSTSTISSFLTINAMYYSVNVNLDWIEILI